MNNWPARSSPQAASLDTLEDLKGNYTTALSHSPYVMTVIDSENGNFIMKFNYAMNDGGAILIIILNSFPSCCNKFNSADCNCM